MRFEAGLACLVLGAAACSSSSSSSGPSDGGSGADVASEGASADGASPDGGGAGGGDDAGPDASDDGPTVCNTLVSSAQPVTATQVATAAPAFQGGTVADGTYVLTAETIYTGPGGATGPSTAQSITLQFQNGTIQVSKDSDPPTSTYLFVPTGMTYQATGECPPLIGDLVGSYTATATTFVASLGAPGGDGGAPVTVETYTRQ